MKEILKAIFNSIDRYLFGVLGVVCAFPEPAVPFILICTLAVFMDCWTAWSLSRGIKRKFPGANNGESKSSYAGCVSVVLTKVYALTVSMFLVQTYILEGLPVRLINTVAEVVCFWRVWPMSENKSSRNGLKWAKIAQRVMVDKTERHLDTDLHELKKGGDNSRY